MRKAPKALRTSDVSRPRTLLWASVGAAAGVAIALGGEAVLDPLPLLTSRPIARPHAKNTCASCHGENTSAPPSPAACQTCHGKSHGSTRAGHQKMVAQGRMTCLTCHHQHAGAQGITFDDGKVIRWGAGVEQTLNQPTTLAKGTTVPLTALTSCTGCHDPGRASDPIAACVPRDVAKRGSNAPGEAPSSLPRVSQCFDEHVRVRESHPSSGEVCARQHGDSRFAAWDAAREIAATTSWVAPSSISDLTASPRPWAPAGGGLAGALVASAISTALERRRRTPVVAKASVVPSAVKKLPVINPSTCLGCYACVDACPFDVLQIEKYVAVVVRPEECCGVVLCEQVCPNGSLRVADGAPILDRPAVDDDLESKDVPGLFLAGDLTGLPLIKNAINQGVRTVDRIAAKRPSGSNRPTTDILIVGAGPAGISAALRAKEKGLSCIILEQATVAASIKSFPREKIVHDPPLDLPIEGELWMERATKEDLLAQWTRIVRARQLEVREGHKVDAIDRVGDGREPKFIVHAAGATFEAARVILAIGRRGTPRQLDAEIEPGAESCIAYALADARSFEGKKVLVVGLGDSAMEAAIAIARQPGTEVTVTYRGAKFARGKAKNIREIERLVADGKVKLLFETQPAVVGPVRTILEGTGPHRGRRTIATDHVLVMIGGEPSWDLLERSGLKRPVDPSKPTA